MNKKVNKLLKINYLHACTHFTFVLKDLALFTGPRAELIPRISIKD